jgi:uncharacterized protein (TIGR02001 family)
VLALSQVASSQVVAQAAAVPQALPEDRSIEGATGLLGDLGFYSDYVARGLSYTRERYSVQGHLEYDSAPGVYGGAYLIHNSEIINKETIEFDPYVGYLRPLGNWSVDVGMISWLYPHSRLDVSGNPYNTLESTLDVTYKVAGIKLWYDLRDYWGLDSGSALPNYGLEPHGSSRGSLYVDSHVNVPLASGWILKLHVGRQLVRNYAMLDYADWLLGLEKAFAHHLSAGGAYTDTNANRSLWVDAHGLELGRSKWTAYLRWSFP